MRIVDYYHRLSFNIFEVIFGASDDGRVWFDLRRHNCRWKTVVAGLFGWSNPVGEREGSVQHVTDRFQRADRLIGRGRRFGRGGGGRGTELLTVLNLLKMGVEDVLGRERRQHHTRLPARTTSVGQRALERRGADQRARAQVNRGCRRLFTANKLMWSVVNSTAQIWKGEKATLASTVFFFFGRASHFLWTRTETRGRSNFSSFRPLFETKMTLKMKTLKGE